jgi:hypothetical protein
VRRTQVPLGCAEWKEQRTLSSFAGPFGQLPVLEWEDKANDELVTVVQTLAIAQYLSFQVCMKNSCVALCVDGGTAQTCERRQGGERNL